MNGVDRGREGTGCIKTKEEHRRKQAKEVAIMSYLRVNIIGHFDYSCYSTIDQAMTKGQETVSLPVLNYVISRKDSLG